MGKQNNFRFEMTISKSFEKDIVKYINKYGFNSIQEFFREAAREKLYGKTREEEIKNNDLKLSLEEENFLFKENKKIYNKLKSISKRN